MAEYRYVVFKEQDFSAAHFLRDYHGMCERMHGHNYKIRICVGANELDSEEMVIDFADLRDTMQRVIARFDHQLLNEVAPFDAVNPTLETFARYLAEEIAREVDTERRRVIECHLWETDRNCAIYKR